MKHRISHYLEAPQPLITGRKVGFHSKSPVYIQMFKAFFDVQPQTFCTWQTVDSDHHNILWDGLGTWKGTNQYKCLRKSASAGNLRQEIEVSFNLASSCWCLLPYSTSLCAPLPGRRGSSPRDRAPLTLHTKGKSRTNRRVRTKDPEKLCATLVTYFANFIQNWVKYFLVEARLSRMMGTFCLMWRITEVT